MCVYNVHLNHLEIQSGQKSSCSRKKIRGTLKKVKNKRKGEGMIILTQLHFKHKSPFNDTHNPAEIILSPLYSQRREQ